MKKNSTLILFSICSALTLTASTLHFYKRKLTDPTQQPPRAAPQATPEPIPSKTNPGESAVDRKPDPQHGLILLISSKDTEELYRIYQYQLSNYYNGPQSSEVEYFDLGVIESGPLAHQKLLLAQFYKNYEGDYESQYDSPPLSTHFFALNEKGEYTLINEKIDPKNTQSEINYAKLSNSADADIFLKSQIKLGGHELKFLTMCRDNLRLCPNLDPKPLMSENGIQVFGNSVYVNDLVLEFKNGKKALYRFMEGEGGHGCAESAENRIPTQEELAQAGQENLSYSIKKDTFGRAYKVNKMGEGECGKPVLYFYPLKTTEVTVELSNSIHPSHTLPHYQKQWKVLAHETGELMDLQPELTDCASSLFSIPGLEYGKMACQSNSYPYLYWSGHVSRAYPSQRKGSIIKAEELKEFLTKQLLEIGLIEAEVSDMLAYWIPELQKTSAPLYRITLFQKSTLDRLFELKIDPAPDTFIRVFLDWEPLYTAPKETIKPQSIRRIQRRGFTVVEWGGLKRYQPTTINAR